MDYNYSIMNTMAVVSKKDLGLPAKVSLFLRRKLFRLRLRRSIVEGKLGMGKTYDSVDILMSDIIR